MFHDPSAMTVPTTTTPTSTSTIGPPDPEDQRGLGDLVETLMRRNDRECIELHDIVSALAVDRRPDDVAQEIAADPRFLIVEARPAVDGLDRWSEAERRRYEPVLRETGLLGTRLVILLDGPAPTSDPPSVARLLDATLVRLATMQADVDLDPTTLAEAASVRAALARI